MNPPERKETDEHTDVFMARIVDALERLSRKTTYLLKDYVLQDVEVPTEKVKLLQESLRRWTSALVIESVYLRKVQTSTTGEKFILGAHIYLELLRMLLVSSYNLLKEEVSVAHVPSSQRSLLIESELEGVRVFQMKQSQVMKACLRLVKLQRTLPQSEINSFKKTLLALKLRAATFFCESPLPEGVIDVPELSEEGKPTIDFAYFCLLYMGGLDRVCFYYDLLSNKMVYDEDRAPPRWARQIKEFILDYVGTMAEESFQELYKSTCEEAYAFCGDDEWFSYTIPEAVCTRGSVIGALRKDTEYKEYFSEDYVSKDTVLALLKEGFKFVAREFAISALNQALLSFHNVQWKHAIFIRNRDIESAQGKIRKEELPLLIELLSATPFVYHNKCVLPGEDIYEQIATWFYILKIYYDSRLLGRDLSEFIATHIDNEQANKFADWRDSSGSDSD